VLGRNETLQHRGCNAAHLFSLLRWFSNLETPIWSWIEVNLDMILKPKKIFLVLGQTMTTDYWITFQDSGDYGCGIQFKGDIPTSLDGKPFIGVGLQGAATSAGAGFEIVSTRRHSRPCSVFLEISESMAPTGGISANQDSESGPLSYVRTLFAK
jgi:hypothetical protein